MDDLISKKGLLNKINAYVVGSQDKEFICKLIEEMPTIDAVEVVRCKYCKYYVGEMFFGREVFLCNRKHKQGSGMMEMTDADDFCSYGERKTDG